jgi:hypothetical protein
MIISASYKTDIPTFYGDWFMNRLNAGFCKTVNSFNGRVSRVSLQRRDVDGFVFWTKNIFPFVQPLEEVSRRGFPFIIQYTVNNYPRILESAVTDAERSVDHIRGLATRYGPRSVVWRYDPILLTTATEVAFHLTNFEGLARQLSGFVDEVVISFAHFYQKTKRNVQAASVQNGFCWRDPSADEKRALVEAFVERAGNYGIALSLCSQPEYHVLGAGAARCIDAKRLSDIGGSEIHVSVKGNRPGCECNESRDIGEYDTCPHGCVYCYAVRDHQLAKEHFREHDPNSEFLFKPANTQEDSGPVYEQLPIF